MPTVARQTSTLKSRCASKSEDTGPHKYRHKARNGAGAALAAAWVDLINCYRVCAAQGGVFARKPM